MPQTVYEKRKIGVGNGGWVVTSGGEVSRSVSIRMADFGDEKKAKEQA